MCWFFLPACSRRGCSEWLSVLSVSIPSTRLGKEKCEVEGSFLCTEGRIREAFQHVVEILLGAARTKKKM